MRILPFLSVIALLTGTSLAQQNLIPAPALLRTKSAESKPFKFLEDSTIYISTGDEEELKCARFVTRMMSEQLAREIRLNESPEGANLEPPQAGEIRFFYDPKLKSKGEETYRIGASCDFVELYYASPKALLRAGASLMQIIEPTTQTLGTKSFGITDYPRYQWRAVMLDEARHFYGEQAVKNLLDQMYLLKMNVFHWHLTDNDGWRVEIKKYPRLTEISSKRADTESVTWKSGKSEGKPHEGFYTQEQIKSIVAYAAERGITIIPEFDVPGHSTAAAVAYPWLSLKKLDAMPTTFGSNLALDPTKESTYEFVSDVFEELVAIFPSPVIHFGGDEVRFAKQWKDEPAIEAFMKEHGYKSLSEVQLHFTKRVQQIIASKGRRAMGWNEIMGGDIHGDGGGGDIQGEVLPETIIHYWDGPTKLVGEAVRKGHDVVNSHCHYTYMDYSYERTPLEKSYSFDPTPADLTEEEQKKILGMGVQVWTEWLPDVPAMQKMLYPRLVALSEVAWSLKSIKDFEGFEGFKKRLEAFTPKLRLEGQETK